MIKKLRREYEKLIGKRCFNGWSAKILKKKMENFKKLQGTETGDTEPDLSKDVEETEDDTDTPKNDFTEEKITATLDHLYHALIDGKYRRMILDVRGMKFKKKEEFIKYLEFLKSQVIEGELKFIIKQHIERLST